MKNEREREAERERGRERELALLDCLALTGAAHRCVLGGITDADADAAAISGQNTWDI